MTSDRTPAADPAFGTGLACGIAAGAAWGLVFLFPLVVPGFTPLELATGRYFGYGVLSLLLVLPDLRAMHARTTRRDLGKAVLLALVGNLAYYLCVALAVRDAGIAPASLIVGALPITITLTNAALDREVAFASTLRRLAAPLALIAAGVVVISIDAFGQHDGSGDRDATTVAIGVVVACGAVLAWTFFAVANTRMLRSQDRLSPQRWNTLTGIATGLVVMPFLPPLARHLVAIEPALAWRFVVACIVVALLASTLAAALWNRASRSLPPTLGGQLIISETVFALIYGFAWEARLPRPLELLAIALLVAGAALSVRRHG